jgi:hypothetical protein
MSFAALHIAKMPAFLSTVLMNVSKLKFTPEQQLTATDLQWFSNDSITGYSDVTKAVSRIA